MAPTNVRPKPHEPSMGAYSDILNDDPLRHSAPWLSIV